jgi:hypothetical protein
MKILEMEIAGEKQAAAGKGTNPLLIVPSK